MHCGKVHLTKFQVEVSLPCTGMSVRSPKITSNWRPSSLKTTIVNSIFVQLESKTKISMSYKSIFMWSTSRLRWNFCTFIFLNPLVSSQPLEGVVRNYFVFFRLELVQHISTGRPEVRIIKSSTKSFGKWCHIFYLQPQISLQSKDVIPHVLLARPHDRLVDVDHGDELGLLLEQWQCVKKTSLHKKF